MKNLTAILCSVLLLCLILAGCSPSAIPQEMTVEKEVTVEAEEAVEAEEIVVVTVEVEATVEPTVDADKVAKEESTKVLVGWFGTLLSEAGKTTAGAACGISVELYNAIATLDKAQENFDALISGMIKLVRGDDPTGNDAAMALMELFGVPKHFQAPSQAEAQKRLQEWSADIETLIRTTDLTKEDVINHLRAMQRQVKLVSAKGNNASGGAYTINWKVWTTDGGEKEWDYMIYNNGGKDITYFELQFPNSIAFEFCDECDIDKDDICDSDESLYEEGGLITIPIGWNCKCHPSSNRLEFWLRGSDCYNNGVIAVGGMKAFKFLVDENYVVSPDVTATVGRWNGPLSDHKKDNGVTVLGPKQ